MINPLRAGKGMKMSEHKVPQAFIDAMNAQLEANKAKGEWIPCNIGWLIMEAVKNLGKLHEEVVGSIGGTNEDIKRRAANIANFAMMIFDKVLQSEKGGNHESDI